MGMPALKIMLNKETTIGRNRKITTGMAILENEQYTCKIKGQQRVTSLMRTLERYFFKILPIYKYVIKISKKKLNINFKITDIKNTFI